MARNSVGLYLGPDVSDDPAIGFAILLGPIDPIHFHRAVPQ